MSDPIRNQRTGFQPEPEFVTIADTVSYQGPPLEANDGPELPLTPDEHRRGVISQGTAKILVTFAREAAKSLQWAGDRVGVGVCDDVAEECIAQAELLYEVVAKAEKELRSETDT